MDPLVAVRTAFAAIDADHAIKDRAIQFLQTWLTHPDFAAYQPQIDWLISAEKWSVLLDSFYQVLPFGTGGRRGAVGIGPNRMNLWTLGASVQGHCGYLRQRFPGIEPLRIVLAYDVRQFEDTRVVYNRDLPNPVLHLTSRNFCEYAAGVYAANGIHSYILPPDSRRYVSTPELSFTIRFLKANGGLNMTASHNPPDDNGSKFYDERGAQPVPPEDQIMSDFVDQVAAIKHIPWSEAVKSGKVHFLDAAPHEAYIEMSRKQALVPAPKADEIRVVYTPLHGVGGGCAGETLEAAGFKSISVQEQSEPNGQFPNVTKSPNPEVPECMDRAERVAREHHADLVIATDPDADRIGGLACTTPDGRGDYRFLTGQEIAAMLTHFKLSRLASAGDLPASPIVITTEVTTGQITRISRHFGAQVVNDLLVGFKYHADVLWHLESMGQYGDVKGTPDDFVIATEESHGVLTTPHIRDKDSAGAALLLAELALHLKRQKRTIPEFLADLARQFGYYRNELRNLVMTGVEGKRDMARMLDALRSNPPTAVGGLPVAGFEDLRDENGRMGPFKGETDRAARNFLIFRLAGDGIEGKVCLRPSGTEPKAKAYVEVSCPPPPPGTPDADWDIVRRRVDDTARAVADDFLTLALRTVNLPPPTNR
jgi:phosphoglucomutase